MEQHIEAVLCTPGLVVLILSYISTQHSLCAKHILEEMYSHVHGISQLVSWWQYLTSKRFYHLARALYVPTADTKLYSDEKSIIHRNPMLIERVTDTIANDHYKYSTKAPVPSLMQFFREMIVLALIHLGHDEELFHQLCDKLPGSTSWFYKPRFLAMVLMVLMLKSWDWKDSLFAKTVATNFCKNKFLCNAKCKTDFKKMTDAIFLPNSTVQKDYKLLAASIIAEMGSIGKVALYHDMVFEFEEELIL